MRTHQLRSCPSCAGTGYETIRLGDHPLRRCTACHLTYATEFADPDDIYVDGYLMGETDFGLDIMHPVFQEYLDFCANRRIDVLEAVTGGPRSLVDVGCGTGEVLRAAKARGWTVAGAEPVAESAAMAVERGLDVKHALLEDSGLPERSFDVVSAFHVLEHMADGTGFLRSISRWAKPGGLVMVEVPNFRSFHRRNNGSGWPNLRPLEHIAHYSPANIRSTMARAGLEPVVVRSLSFLWEKMSLRQALADLARPGLYRFLAPFGRTEVVKDEPDRLPGPIVLPVLRGIAAVYDKARVGQVAIGIGRVPITE